MRRWMCLALLLIGAIALNLPADAALPGFVKLKNGYFCDSVTGQPFVPHGIAYQTWNRPLGVWQTYDQIDYDLDEMVKMNANSIRVDFVWQHVEEDGDNQFKWANYDYLIQACEKRNIRIFALVGYQWPPNWFPDAWYTQHPPETDAEGILHTNRWQSDIINYEHPQARAQYAEWIGTVCARYKDSKAIAGWIVGNESGYLGLWSGLLDGYDPECEQAFRTWCQAKYGAVSNVNAAWGTQYGAFSNIVFVDQYRAYGVEGAEWADMVQWREDSIASFTAVGARAAKTADTNHLISYSTVGMQWGEEDWRYHAEHRGRITAACLATNAAIDFFSVNNYPWSILGHESQNGRWGVTYTKKIAKVPVLYSETGFTSSETMWPGMNEQREGPLVRNALWESLEVGSVGTHIFSWMDRPWITDREKGFGILYSDRSVKPAYWVCRDAYNLMEQVDLPKLLMGSQDAKPDIAFLWTDAVDSQHNRYECEMQQIAGALERVGYEPGFIGLDELGSGAYTNYKVIILPRNLRVEDVVPNSTNKTVLDFLRTVAIPKGIHIMASADLPGQQNFNGKPRTNFVNEVRNLFGVDPSDVGGVEAPMRRKEFVSSYWQGLSVRFTSNVVGSLTNGYTYDPMVWKYNDETVLSTGGVLWADMDSLRNKGFEDDAGNSTTLSKWDGVWVSTNRSGLYVRSKDWATWQYSGSNMVQIWGDAVMWKDFPAVPFGRYTASAYLRNNSDDPLRNGSAASVSLEYYDKEGNFLGVLESPLLATNTPGNAWVRYAVDDFAPSNTYRARRVIRIRPKNLLTNGALTGTSPAPAGWSQWTDSSHDPAADPHLGTGGNSWNFWWEGGIYQDITSGFAAGDKLSFGGWLLSPGNDHLRNGTKYGVIQAELYNGTSLVSTVSAGPTISWGSTNDVWIPSTAEVTVPAGVTTVRVLVRCNDYSSGDGTFRVDDVFVRNTSKGDGSAFVDNQARNPATVVKNHGTAKAAIFLYAAGDIGTDGNHDGEMDVLPWKWRYDIFGAIVRDYFGVQPKITVTGTNAYLCLPAYRVCTNGAILAQVKNYWYDRFQTNGGSPSTFTISGSLFTGRTIRAFEQCRIIETNSDGVFPITLVPDGQELILASLPSTNRTELVQIADAPALVHPFGDKVYSIKVNFDTRGQSGLKLKAAFMEAGDNGDGITNEIYSIMTNGVSGSGQTNFWMWIPDYNQNHADYKSTPDGGKYQFAAWLESTSGVKLAEALPQSTILEWGLRPTNAMPATLSKGQAVNVGVEWEDLYEQLFWQTTPLTRGQVFPSRIAVLRSSKTETWYPGHFDKVNEVANWLESLGYVAGNGLDLSFDNVTVSNGTYFKDDFEDGNYTGWTRAAGCGNWAATTMSTTKCLRAWRIGNSDNILVYSGTFTNATISTDIRYNKQDPYFNDAELYFRYQNRDNFYKIGIRNYYGFWRLRYMVRVSTNIQQQGWICDFPKTNRPTTNVWYNLKVQSYGSTNKVYFNGTYVGTFWATNFASGRVAVGSAATQLGIWEPQKGYYFIDDDEYSFWAPEGQQPTSGKPLNLDFGYLEGFYNTLVLPSVYVMSDVEVSNLCIWVTNGLNSIIATDGSIGMKNEGGTNDLGRLERLFGVGTAVGTLSNVTRVAVGTREHYVTLDYPTGRQFTASGVARPWPALGAGIGLGTVANATGSAPALIVNTVTNNWAAPAKVFCFNFGVDTGGQLTNAFKTLAQRAFEWTRGQAYKVRLELKYQVNPAWPSGDIVLCVTNGWLLTGSGTSTLIVNVPTDGIMTGDKLYWSGYVYPWDATNTWASHAGFFSTANDGSFTKLTGKGLQILGGSTNAFAGRNWDLWFAYNTESQDCTLVYGIKDKGTLSDEDNFDDGNYNGWAVTANTNIAWTVTNGALRASVVSTGGYSYVNRQTFGLGVTNLTFEYNTRFLNGARHGGALYRGVVLYVNPQLCGWQDNDPVFVTNAVIATGVWHHVVISVRDGSPFMRSDLIVDGKVIFLNEPIEVTSFATNTIGLLSPYYPGYVEWDNTRVCDEQYSYVTQTVNGVYVPTNTTTPFYAFVPDYDPAMWEHEGTILGGRYEWFAYLRGAGVHSVAGTEVLFAPRIMDENTNFPAAMNPGQTVKVPVEWQRLPTVPAAMRLTLQDVWSGVIYSTNTVILSNATGSALVSVPVPEQTPSGSSFAWAAYVYPTNAADPMAARIGLDDTFRYGRDGVAMKAETAVSVSPVIGYDYNVYRDSGLPLGCDILTWQGGTTTFDGNYTGGSAPEGSKCFLTTCSSWAGWGVFSTTNSVNMTEYRDGFLKFWLRSTATVKVELEQWSGTKATVYVSSTSNVWKEIVLPISGFSGVDLATIKGLFEVTSDTATTFYIDYIRWTKGIVRIYNDAGIYTGSKITNSAGGTATFNSHYTDGAAPEGVECFQATGSTWASWGVVMSNGVADMSLYSNGYVCFWARCSAGLKVELEGPMGTKRTNAIASTTGVWKEITIPLSSFSGINAAQMYRLFGVSSTNGTSFLIDDVRWKKGTNAVPSEQKEVFYSDAGIPVGADILVWWANSAWNHLSPSVDDGGFESSASGAFPNAGFWQFTNAAGSPASLCTTAALRSGANGLREQTGTNTTATWASTFQEVPAYAGDIFSGQVYARQLSGQTWVSNSTGFLRLQFLDAWHQVLTNYVSATKVTAAGQAWTLCSIPSTTAPFATRYARCELVVQKPSGVAGASVVDFDDALLSQANSFYGNFAEDPTVPEGTKCFRSYCVGWSGWGIFYTNTVTNLSQYANGYVKFWYKSSGYTRIEIQSVWSGVTNKAAYPSSGWFGPTLNGSGDVVWQQKSIPVSAFAGVDLAHIKSPFMVTDPVYDHSFYVDQVRWAKEP